MEIRLPESAGEIAATLKQIVQEGSLSDLGGAVAGGLLYQVFAGVLSIPLGFAEALSTSISLVTSALSSGVGDVTSAFVIESTFVWDAFGGGVFSLILNLGAMIALAWLVARGYEVIQSG